MLVARCADHLPLYRQAQTWGRQGVAIDRSTLASWVGTAAAEPAPVAAGLKHIVLASARIFADETVMAGARSRPRAHQEGILLGDRARRPALGHCRKPVIGSIEQPEVSHQRRSKVAIRVAIVAAGKRTCRRFSERLQPYCLSTLINNC